MSEFDVVVKPGAKKRLLTAGKYCDRNIIVEAEDGYSEGYTAGYDAGYNRGYEEGYNAGSQQQTAILGKAVLGKMKLA
jgi:flagellar biosynthesis/type III secretory pathway protein FliH